jgi:hypothetical protein
MGYQHLVVATATQVKIISTQSCRVSHTFLPEAKIYSL